MWKLKQSKYKNAFPKKPRKEEWIGEISANALLHSCGNHIKANGTHMVFSTDNSGGSNLTVLPIDARGRQDPAHMKHIKAHADYVTDFDLSPCDNSLLSTCSLDCSVKVWRLPEEMEEETMCNAEATFHGFTKRVESVAWHPCSNAILAVTSENLVKIYDVTAQEEKYELANHSDQIQSVGWKLDGSQLVTSCKDRKIRLWDPRTQTVAHEAEGHKGVKDSRAVWLGDRDYVLTSGFNSVREREISLRDTRMGLNTTASMAFDTASGVLMPLFDPDTNMLFLAGQGDTTLRFLEVNEREPYLTVSGQDPLEQVKGVAMVPKRALDVMSGEVNRILVLAKQCVIPVPYIVPRKSYHDYHAELFPDTYAAQSSVTAAQWCGGQNVQRERVSLDPSKSKSQSKVKAVPPPPVKQIEEKPVDSTQPPLFKTEPQKKPEAPVNASRPSDVTSGSVTSERNVSPAQVLMRDRKPKVFSAVRQSKFKHLTGTAMHKDTHIDNIRNLSHSIPGESNMFAANKTFCAVPLAGSGGLVAVLKTQDGGRLPDTGTPMIQNGSAVMDFEFDPFDDTRLAVGCDDAVVRIWHLPTDTIEETLTEPSVCLRGHTEKLYFVRFHPLAKDIVASASYDMTVRVWDLSAESEALRLEGHTDTIFCLSWSPDGRLCATLCKDGLLRIYEPRTSTLPVKEGKGPEGTRGGRITWACDGKLLIATGFGKSSGRVVLVYKADDLSATVAKVDLDTSPAILVPHYDPDSTTLFLTGRGDSTVKAYEVSDEHPHLFQLSDVTSSGPHQGLAFLPKNELDVRNVEFAKAMRLTNNSIEPISFQVPRVKREFFQDDIFPETRVTWEAAVSAEEWLSGTDRAQATTSLQPSDMKQLSHARVEAPKPHKYQAFDDYQKTYKTDEEKREELVSAMSDKLDIQEDPLPQDLNEGVDSDEWED